MQKDSSFCTDTYIPNPVISIREDTPPASITMFGGADEMLRVARDGFYVRGVKIPQDEREAEAVYNAFKAWMIWAQLNKDYQ